MIKFQAFHGTVTMINDFWVNAKGDFSGCYKLISVKNQDGSLVNFVIEPTTYFVENVMVEIGDRVIGFYDANAPVPMIFPPQFRAIVMAKNTSHYNVKVDYFDRYLVSEDGQLKLNIALGTKLILENGQSFTANPTNRYLIVVYGVSTKSIPAQTTPYKIIVMCGNNNK